MNFLFTGAIGGFLAVCLDALAAHALKDTLSGYSVEIFKTAADYHAYYSLALILVALLLQKNTSYRLIWSGRCFLLGMIFFCGSLYALSLTGIKWLGAITPIGGVLFMAGWLLLALYALKEYRC